MMRFLCLVLLALVASASAEEQVPESDRSLSLWHTHTGESLEITYYKNGEYLPEAMAVLRKFLADWRDGSEHEIDPQLMDILWQIEQSTGHHGTWEVISAYRSPETNQMLRERSSGVARKSQHLQGTAIDVRLRGMELETLRDAAVELKRGGVGYYPKPDFVHIDTGRVRRW